jgi:hypothetical protein
MLEQWGIMNHMVEVIIDKKVKCDLIICKNGWITSRNSPIDVKCPKCDGTGFIIK